MSGKRPGTILSWHQDEADSPVPCNSSVPFASRLGLWCRSTRGPALECEADGNYHICEYYLSVISPVLPDALYLGSVDALRVPASLARHRISHVLLLCSRPHTAVRSPSSGASFPATFPTQNLTNGCRCAN